MTANVTGVLVKQVVDSTMSSSVSRDSVSDLQ